MSASPAAPEPADRAVRADGGWDGAAPVAVPRATVHRQPVVAADSVRGYAFHVGVRDAPTGPRRVLELESLVHAEYDALDLGALTGGTVAFVRATAAMLTGRRPAPPAPHGLVLEVPTDFTARPDAVEHLARLRAEGVGLALADYRPGGYGDALLSLVDFVKVDLARGTMTASRAVRRAQTAGLAVIVERVDTEAAVQFCVAHAVDLMQGPLFPRDTTAATRDLTAGQLQCLELMQLLSSDPVDHAAVVRMVGSDPELAMRVLRLVNLSAFAVRQKVDSVHQAVVLVGPHHLATLAMTALVDARTSTVSSLWFALSRALACRALAGHDGAYTVGLLSAVSAQLRLDPLELVGRTGVSTDVADALRDRTGPWGPALAAVLAHEADDAPGVDASGVDPQVVSAAYLDAVTEAFDTATALAGAA